MKRMKFFASLVAWAFFMGGMAPAATTASHAGTWSGYVDKGATFTYVSASWIQPAVSCPVPTARVSFWIGFDGFGNGTVEQAGTFVKCSLNAPVDYRAFWEMFDGKNSPGGENFPVSPAIRSSLRSDTRGAHTLSKSATRRTTNTSR